MEFGVTFSLLVSLVLIVTVQSEGDAGQGIGDVGEGLYGAPHSSHFQGLLKPSPLRYDEKDFGISGSSAHESNLNDFYAGPGSTYYRNPQENLGSQQQHLGGQGPQLSKPMIPLLGLQQDLGQILQSPLIAHPNRHEVSQTHGEASLYHQNGHGYSGGVIPNQLRGKPTSPQEYEPLFAPVFDKAVVGHPAPKYVPAGSKLPLSNGKPAYPTLNNYYENPFLAPKGPIAPLKHVVPVPDKLLGKSYLHELLMGPLNHYKQGHYQQHKALPFEVQNHVGPAHPENPHHQTFHKHPAHENAIEVQLAQDQAAYAQLAHENAARAQAAHEHAVRVKALQEHAARAQVANEHAARVQAAHENVARAQAAHKNAVRAHVAHEHVLRGQALNGHVAHNHATHNHVAHNPVAHNHVAHAQAAHEHITHSQATPVHSGHAAHSHVAHTAHSHVAHTLVSHPNKAHYSPDVSAMSITPSMSYGYSYKLVPDSLKVHGVKPQGVKYHPHSRSGGFDNMDKFIADSALKAAPAIIDGHYGTQGHGADHVGQKALVALEKHFPGLEDSRHLHQHLIN